MQRGKNGERKRERRFFPQRTDLCRSSGPRGRARAGEGKAETGSKFTTAMEWQRNLAQEMKVVVKTTIGWTGDLFAYPLFNSGPLILS